MKVIIENTSKIVKLNGIETRIWEGQTASGVPVHCYIVRIAVSPDMPAAEFQKELQECRAPSADVEGIPLRMIL